VRRMFVLLAFGLPVLASIIGFMSASLLYGLEGWDMQDCFFSKAEGCGRQD